MIRQKSPQRDLPDYSFDRTEASARSCYSTVSTFNKIQTLPRANHCFWDEKTLPGGSRAAMYVFARLSRHENRQLGHPLAHCHSFKIALEASHRSKPHRTNETSLKVSLNSCTFHSRRPAPSHRVDGVSLYMAKHNIRALIGVCVDILLRTVRILYTVESPRNNMVSP